jgi:hypothetical protein
MIGSKIRAVAKLSGRRGDGDSLWEYFCDEAVLQATAPG